MNNYIFTIKVSNIPRFHSPVTRLIKADSLDIAFSNLKMSLFNDHNSPNDFEVLHLTIEPVPVAVGDKEITGFLSNLYVCLDSRMPLNVKKWKGWTIDLLNKIVLTNGK